MKEHFSIRALFGGIFPRIAVMFLVVLVISSVIILFFMSNVFQEKTFEETLRSQTYSILQLTSGLDTYLDSIDQLTLSIIYDRNVQSILQGKEPEYYSLNALLGSSARQENLYIMLSDGYGQVYSSSNILMPLQSTARLEQTDLYSRMQKTYAALHWDLCANNLMSDQPGVKESWMLTAGRQVRHLDIDSRAGNIVVQVFPSMLVSQMQDPLMHADARFLLLNKNNRVVYDSWGKFSINDLMAAPVLLEHVNAGDNNFFGETELGNQLYVFGFTKKAELKLISCLPDEALFSTLPDLFRMLLRATVLGIVIALILALIFSLYFSRPIMEIVLAMRRVRDGDFAVQVKPCHNNEIGELAYTFNVMVKDMGELMEQAKRDQHELKSAEFNALLYQINPHFIYNTLDNINMLARLSEDKRMSVMITELSSLLRITLSSGQDVVSVKHELRHVSNYLRIMQLRNDDLFDYEIRCQEGLEEIQVLKVILQPIAENAIQHGFGFTESNGLLRIVASSLDGHLVLQVEDNGVGMDQYDANCLMDKLRKNMAISGSTSGIGLKNIWSRLRIFYGENGFRMHFLSSELGGLMVKITLFNLVH
jgi:two-component system sensor histidine kinase YesM